MLLSIPNKVLCKVILNRIDKQIKIRTSWIDQIFTVIEQCTEFNKQLHVNFVDFSKDLDSIHRQTL